MWLSWPCHAFDADCPDGPVECRAASFQKKDELAIEGVTPMTNVSSLQQLLRASTTADGKVSGETPAAKTPSFIAAVQSARTPAWDPHEVWLNRVKKPREQRSER
jgi:hypothetical protein